MDLAFTLSIKISSYGPRSLLQVLYQINIGWQPFDGKQFIPCKPPCILMFEKRWLGPCKSTKETMQTDVKGLTCSWTIRNGFIMVIDYPKEGAYVNLCSKFFANLSLKCLLQGLLGLHFPSWELPIATH